MQWYKQYKRVYRYSVVLHTTCTVQPKPHTSATTVHGGRRQTSICKRSDCLPDKPSLYPKTHHILLPQNDKLSHTWSLFQSMRRNTQGEQIYGGYFSFHINIHLLPQAQNCATNITAPCPPSLPQVHVSYNITRPPPPPYLFMLLNYLFI